MLLVVFVSLSDTPLTNSTYGSTQPQKAYLAYHARSLTLFRCLTRIARPYILFSTNRSRSDSVSASRAAKHRLSDSEDEDPSPLLSSALSGGSAGAAETGGLAGSGGSGGSGTGGGGAFTRKGGPSTLPSGGSNAGHAGGGKAAASSAARQHNVDVVDLKMQVRQGVIRHVCIIRR